MKRGGIDLNELEQKSIFILGEAYAQFKKPAIMWSIGKYSTTLLWLCKKAFFGKIPFPVIHIDTTYKFLKYMNLEIEFPTNGS
jgi:sulfate adenylyltransferase subunit 2